MKFVCVYKTGGDFTAEYVHRLYEMLDRNIDLPFQFICLTDSDEDVPGKRKLTYNWQGWWSKLEIFEIEGPCIYFDLDTMVVGNITEFVWNLARANASDKMYMLTPFNKHRRSQGKFASGIMAWIGDWRWLTRTFDPSAMLNYKGDQVYINEALIKEGALIHPISNLIDGICSYKWHCRKGVPEPAKIVCFHGNPRPHQIKWKI